MSRPTCDNDCIRMGWVEYYVSRGCADLHVSVPPNADLGGEVLCFCHDIQESLTVKGWLAVWEKVVVI